MILTNTPLSCDGEHYAPRQDRGATAAGRWGYNLGRTGEEDKDDDDDELNG